jgi:site-specific DNA-adenine methylase
MTKELKAPFTYFGGKSKVADVVWRALGCPDHYIEPFFGSGAVLLARPDYGGQLETVNDADGLVSNTWRALQKAPDEVAKYCDWPVLHVDLISRKKFLRDRGPAMIKKLLDDPEYFDAKMAGYWIWGSSCSIGKAMVCAGDIIPEISGSGKGVHARGAKAKVDNKIPFLAGIGKGVHSKKASKDQHIAGVDCSRPAISRPSYGVHQAKMPVEGLDVRDPYNGYLYTWFRKLSERLRNVRVVSGDWSRVCGGNWQDHSGIAAIFMDPPYGTEADRATNIYGVDTLDVAVKVREWCRERGKKVSYRIVLAGYYEEHESLLQDNWTVHRWKATGGYAHTGGGKDGKGRKNAKREALFFSPYCLRNRRTLFGESV